MDSPSTLPIPPPSSGQTITCENLTFPHTMYLVGKNGAHLVSLTQIQLGKANSADCVGNCYGRLVHLPLFIYRQIDSVIFFFPQTKLDKVKVAVARRMPLNTELTCHSHENCSHRCVILLFNVICPTQLIRIICKWQENFSCR